MFFGQGLSMSWRLILGLISNQSEGESGDFTGAVKILSAVNNRAEFKTERSIPPSVRRQSRCKCDEGRATMALPHMHSIRKISGRSHGSARSLHCSSAACSRSIPSSLSGILGTQLR